MKCIRNTDYVQEKAVGRAVLSFSGAVAICCLLIGLGKGKDRGALQGKPNENDQRTPWLCHQDYCVDSKYAAVNKCPLDHLQEHARRDRKAGDE